MTRKEAIEFLFEIADGCEDVMPAERDAFMDRFWQALSALGVKDEEWPDSENWGS